MDRDLKSENESKATEGSSNALMIAAFVLASLVMLHDIIFGVTVPSMLSFTFAMLLLIFDLYFDVMPIIEREGFWNSIKKRKVVFGSFAIVCVVAIGFGAMAAHMIMG